MTTRTRTALLPRYLLLLATLMLFAAAAATAQVPVDDEGNPVGSVTSADENAPDAELPVRSMQELEALIGPIALYPDDLLAIVLPASTYPLEIVQAARFLDEFENDSSLKADDSWDESITALLNYPEVLRMMNEDIDWTWQLGEAVVAQQSDVIAAVEAFRDRAYAAGNLKTDEHQTVSRSDDDVIEIEPVDDDVIYVPYYEPEQVVIYQPRPVYYYYPRAYPVYYYPYPAGHYFAHDYFWGVTTAFRIGWTSNYLHVYHPSFLGHPYFGHSYYGHYWRRPSITVFNSYYGNHGYRQRSERDRQGSYWRPRHRGGARPGHSEARSRYYANGRRSHSDSGYADRRRAGDVLQRDDRRDASSRRDARRDRGQVQTVQPGIRAERRQTDRDAGAPPVRFRSREQNSPVNRGQRAELAQRHHTRIAGRARNDSTTPSQRREVPATGNASRARISSSQPLNRRRAETVANSRQRAEPVARGAVQRRPIAVRGRTHQAAPARSAPVQRQARPAAPSRSTRSRASETRPSSQPQSAPSVDQNGGRRDSNRRRNHR